MQLVHTYSIEFSLKKSIFNHIENPKKSIEILIFFNRGCFGVPSLVGDVELEVEEVVEEQVGEVLVVPVPVVV